MDILAEAVCLYNSDGSPTIVTSLASACCCEVLCGNTAFMWNKYPVVFSDIPEFCLHYKLSTTKNIELATHGFQG